MKKVWKILLIIAGFISLALILHFSPLESITNRLNFFQKNCTLSVDSRASTARIYINGKEYGRTPQTISNLSEGKYLVELERISEESGIYPKQSFYVQLHRNTEAVINVEIAPDNFKSGHVLYYTPLPKMMDNMGAITVSSDLNDLEVWLDGEKLNENETSFYQLRANEYDIKIEGKGYESIEFPVIVRDGYNLNIVAYLLPIPVTF